jgi:hypothetical protein
MCHMSVCASCSYLNDNQLTGQLPAEWGNMKSLRVL